MVTDLGVTRPPAKLSWHLHMLVHSCACISKRVSPMPRTFRTPSLSSLGRQLGKNKSGLSVMHPGKKSVSSLITVSSVEQGSNICKCMCTHCFQVQTGVQSPASRVHRHTYACAHLSGWVPENGTSTCSNRQHTIIQLCPKLSAEQHKHMCVFHMMCENTHIWTPFLHMYTHTC